MAVTALLIVLLISLSESTGLFGSTESIRSSSVTIPPRICISLSVMKMYAMFPLLFRVISNIVSILALKNFITPFVTLVTKYDNKLVFTSSPIFKPKCIIKCHSTIRI